MEILAFPWDQRKEVLYRVLAAPHLATRVEIKERLITNIVERETLKIQYVTNTYEAKKEQFIGRLLGTGIGSIIIGLTLGITISTTAGPTTVQGLLIGCGAGAACIGIGFVFDMAHGLKINLLLPK